MDADELRLLRLQNQFLLFPATEREVVSGLIGLQAQYGANALHALAIRSAPNPDASFCVKTWSLRGALHLHAVDDLPTVLYRGSETAFGQMAFDSNRIEPARAERFRAAILGALQNGDKTREELKSVCERQELTAREAEIVLHPWGGLFRGMAERGEIAYAPERTRVFTRCAPFTPLPQKEAMQQLMRRYLAFYAPVSLRDAQTFFGMPQKQLKPLIERLAMEQFTLAGTTYFSLGQQAAGEANLPDVVFLAGFDPLLLGYRKSENPVLPIESVKEVYNNTGIVFPTVLLNGTVRAVWKRSGKGIAIRPLSKLTMREKKSIARKAVDNLGAAGVQWVQ